MSKVPDSELRIVGANRIEGYRRSSLWAKEQIVYFVAEFSKPFIDNEIAVGNDENAAKLFVQECAVFSSRRIDSTEAKSSKKKSRSKAAFLFADIYLKTTICCKCPF